MGELQYFLESAAPNYHFDWLYASFCAAHRAIGDFCILIVDYQMLLKLFCILFSESLFKLLCPEQNLKM